MNGAYEAAKELVNQMENLMDAGRRLSPMEERHAIQMIEDIKKFVERRKEDRRQRNAA